MRKLNRSKPVAEKTSWKIKLGNGQTLTVESDKVLVPSSMGEPYLFHNGEPMHDLRLVVPAVQVVWVRKV